MKRTLLTILTWLLLSSIQSAIPIYFIGQSALANTEGIGGGIVAAILSAMVALFYCSLSPIEIYIWRVVNKKYSSSYPWEPDLGGIVIPGFFITLIFFLFVWVIQDQNGYLTAFSLTLAAMLIFGGLPCIIATISATFYAKNKASQAKLTQ